MRITYAITVADEFEEFKLLFKTLQINKREEDNIIVLVDNNKCPESCEFWDFLFDLHRARYIKLISDNFNGNFAEWKNKLKNHPLCKDYIFFIDADENPNPQLIADLPLILELNPNVDVFGIARSNFVKGITPEHIQKWGWRIDSKNRINYPDFQYRICKNISKLNWEGKVHETILGFTLRTELPTESEYELLHIKKIDKQEKQNELYSKL